MSNARNLDPAKPIRGDFGLGLCLACLTDHVTAAAEVAAATAAGSVTLPRAPAPVQFAIVMVPSPVPVPGPGGTIQGVGIVTLPSCYDHLQATPAVAPSRPFTPGRPG